MVSPRFEAAAYLPRHAYDPHDRARAADIWRAFQELAVGASTHNGWPPSRYREHRCAFVMRSMCVVHSRQASYGEDIHGQTWVRRMRRQMLSTREVRLSVHSAAGPLPLALGTQEWVHVDENMKPVRGAPALIEAFPPFESPTVVMPKWTPFEHQRSESTIEFDVWRTWMDPLGHVNHPQYLDFAEEALCRIFAEVDIDSGDIIPKAESLTFFRGLIAGERARVRTRFVGKSPLGVVSEHVIERAGDEAVCAKATLHRAHRSLDLSLAIETPPKR